MPVYLHDIPLEDAKAHFETALKEAQLWGVLGKEMIPLDENALGRVLAEPILAKVSSPHYHAAAMDGFVAARRPNRGRTTLQIQLYCKSVIKPDMSIPVILCRKGLMLSSRLRM